MGLLQQGPDGCSTRRWWPHLLSSWDCPIPVGGCAAAFTPPLRTPLGSRRGAYQIFTSLWEPKKNPPGGTPAGSGSTGLQVVCRLAEAEASTDPEDPGADDLLDVVGVGTGQPVLALDDVAVVQHVEAVDPHRHAEVLEVELLLDAAIQQVDVLVAEAVVVVGDDDVRGAVEAVALHATEVRDRVALAAGGVQREVEAPRTVGRDLVQAVDVVGPVAVDVDGAARAVAGRGALQDGFAVP